MCAGGWKNIWPERYHRFEYTKAEMQQCFCSTQMIWKRMREKKKTPAKHLLSHFFTAFMVPVNVCPIREAWAEKEFGCQMSCGRRACPIYRTAPLTPDSGDTSCHTDCIIPKLNSVRYLNLFLLYVTGVLLPKDECHSYHFGTVEFQEIFCCDINCLNSFSKQFRIIIQPHCNLAIIGYSDSSHQKQVPKIRIWVQSSFLCFKRLNEKFQQQKLVKMRKMGFTNYFQKVGKLFLTLLDEI